MGGLLAAGLVYAFWPRPVLVDMVTVAPGPLTVTVDEEGETRVRDVYVVSSPIAGRALRIESDVGDPVVEDKTVVARIEPSDPAFLDLRSETEARAAIDAALAAKALSEARLVEAEADLEFADAELQRARRLIQGDTISQRALDEAERAFKTSTATVKTMQAELRMRQSEVAMARARLVSPIEVKDRETCDCVTILAPRDGRILRLIHESEGVVQAGEPLLEIGDPRDLEIVADYLSTDAVRIEAGQTAIIEDWGGDAPLSGRVRRVEPYGFTKTSALGIDEQRVNVIIDLTAPPGTWVRLGHGFRVEARVVLWARDDAIRLPLTALFREGEQWAVFVNESGRATQRVVEVGRDNGLEADIAAGLEVGDQVVLHPGDRIAEGVRVRARP